MAPATVTTCYRRRLGEPSHRRASSGRVETPDQLERALRRTLARHTPPPPPDPLSGRRIRYVPGPDGEPVQIHYDADGRVVAIGPYRM